MNAVKRSHFRNSNHHFYNLFPGANVVKCVHNRAAEPERIALIFWLRLTSAPGTEVWRFPLMAAFLFSEPFFFNPLCGHEEQESICVTQRHVTDKKRHQRVIFLQRIPPEQHAHYTTFKSFKQNFEAFEFASIITFIAFNSFTSCISMKSRILLRMDK